MAFSSDTDEFWQDILHNLSIPLQLPRLTSSHSFVAQRSTQRIDLSHETTSDLNSFAHTFNLGIDTIVLGVWGCLLSRYTRESEFILGITRLQRQEGLKKDDDARGNPFNPLPIRISLPPQTSVIDWLQDLEERWTIWQNHENTSLQQIKAGSGIEDSVPLFETLLVLDSETGGLQSLRSQKFTDQDYDLSPYPLVLWANTQGDISLDIRYDKAQFCPEAIARMQGHLETLITGILTDPDRELTQLPLLTATERQQLLVEWNQTQTNYPRDKCVHQLFEEQVERTPDAIAIIFESQHLTYRELNNRANQLAHYLQKQGVKPEVLVGICIERSIEMVVGLLGILKAGGAYVPLDPMYPSERLACMVLDSQISILLTQENLLSVLPEHPACVICLARDWNQIAENPWNNCANLSFSSHLVYVLYTSGSTGRPKGVAIAHQSAVALIDWAKVFFTLEQLAGVLASTSICFDLSVFELFLPLSCGGKTIITANVLHLPTLAAAQEVTLINTVPSAIAQLLRMKGIPHSVNTVNLAGEPLANSLAQAIYQLETVQFVFNLYGPSEDTTYSTVALVQKGATTAPLIGRPIYNTQTYLLDRHLQPVPIGIEGELHLGGNGLARGYLNRPELTAEKFIPNPFSDEPGARLYKTGDLCRYLSDGNIEYLGRIDYQVKIRGFRIELGEIEAALRQHEAVQETVVIAREDTPGDRRLVAYVKISPSITQSKIQQKLRTYVRQKLPNYMMPSAFIILDTFPLTPNGKIDRKALPAPNWSLENRQDTFIPPKNPIEIQLAQIWQDVLNIQSIGTNDNFFEMGGHSLLAVQIISRIRQRLGVELPLSILFNSPTIAQLAQKIQTTPTTDPIIPIAYQANRPQILPLSFAQQRLWFLDQLEPNSVAYNIPEAYRLKGILNSHALEESLVEIIRRHESLRTTIQSQNGQPLQKITPDITLVLPVITLENLEEKSREKEAKNLAIQEVQQPFNLATGPLFRFKLLRLTSDDHILLVTLHHIIADGWSMGVFFQELAELYQAYAVGKPSPLPDLALQYADYALWQRKTLTEEVLKPQISYWQQQLGSNLPILQLPTDFPRPMTQTHYGQQQSLLLSQKLSTKLQQLSQASDTTLFMTLLAAFYILLSRYSGQEDIIVGTPNAGRNHIETEPLIGFFVNTLALRTSLAGNLSFRELLNRVKQVTLEAYSHQDIPFEKLVEILQPERDTSRTPIFQVWFNMINLKDTKFKLSDLDTAQINGLNATSKFDLTLYLRETRQGIQLQLVYNSNLFEVATIARMLNHYQTLLEGIVGHSSQPISTLSLFSETERQQLAKPRNIVYPNNFFTEWSQQDIHQSISSRFEQQVHKFPNQIAVQTETHRWTYHQLNQEANRIANILQKEIPEEDARIGIFFEHDAPMIAAILGVLKSGKTYVPLDPSYPQERILYILEDSLSCLIITNLQNWEKAQKLVAGSLPIVNIKDSSTLDNFHEINVAISPDKIAYLLYTSGSTGQPKGVIQNHRNVLNHIRNYTHNLHISPNDKLTLFSSYSFDASVIDIFAALLNGATLFPVNLKEEGLRNLSQWLDEQEITIYHSTPTVYRQLIQELSYNNFPRKARLWSLRLVVLGGEEVVKQDVEHYREYFADHCILVNGFGSTEFSFILQYLMNKETVIKSHLIPVGYPFEETEIIFLDASGKQTELGGEIAIKSPYIALGYWRKPDLTEAVFLDSSEEMHQKIYCTGDLGRLKADGVIEFLGRKDFQVKIRGFRVELGEIEATLCQHPAVQKAVVIAREDISKEKRLVAYIIPELIAHPPSLIPGQLRSFLEGKLPFYLMPSAFVLLDAIPLTPNGKIDRLALPNPDFSSAHSSTTYLSPRNLLEQMLMSIWQEILPVKRLGIRDSFFDLGGHSLLAVQLFSHIQRRLGYDLPLATLYQAPNIEKLAQILENRGWKSQWSSLVAIQPQGRQRPFFFHGGSADALTWANFARQLGEDQPFYALQRPDLNGQPINNQTIEEMALLCLKEIQMVQPEGPYLIGGHCLGGTIAFEIAQQIQAQGQKVALLALVDAYAPLAHLFAESQTISLRSQWHRFDFWFAKSYYYHGSKLQPGRLVQGFNRLLDLGLKKMQSQLKGRSTLVPLTASLAATPQTHVRSSLPYELRYRLAGEANRQARSTYLPQSYSGQITLFRASKQTAEWAFGRDLGWDNLTTEQVKNFTIAGFFGNLFNSKSLPLLVDQVQACLTEVSSED